VGLVVEDAERLDILHQNFPVGGALINLANVAQDNGAGSDAGQACWRLHDVKARAAFQQSKELKKKGRTS